MNFSRSANAPSAEMSHARPQTNPKKKKKLMKLAHGGGSGVTTWAGYLECMDLGIRDVLPTIELAKDPSRTTSNSHKCGHELNLNEIRELVVAILLDRQVPSNFVMKHRGFIQSVVIVHLGECDERAFQLVTSVLVDVGSSGATTGQGLSFLTRVRLTRSSQLSVVPFLPHRLLTTDGWEIRGRSAIAGDHSAAFSSVRTLSDKPAIASLHCADADDDKDASVLKKPTVLDGAAATAGQAASDDRSPASKTMKISRTADRYAGLESALSQYVLSPSLMRMWGYPLPAAVPAGVPSGTSSTYYTLSETARDADLNKGAMQNTSFIPPISAARRSLPSLYNAGSVPTAEEAYWIFAELRADSGASIFVSPEHSANASFTAATTTGSTQSNEDNARIDCSSVVDKKVHSDSEYILTAAASSEIYRRLSSASCEYCFNQEEKGTGGSLQDGKEEGKLVFALPLRIAAIDCEMCGTQSSNNALCRISILTTDAPISSNSSVAALNDQTGEVSDVKMHTVLDCFVNPTLMFKPVSTVLSAAVCGRMEAANEEERLAGGLVTVDKVTEYRTAYSGITAELLSGVQTTLAQVQLLFMRLICADSTILVGHSLENDLHALRMVHCRCVDTAVLYPHPRGGSYSLRRRTGVIAARTSTVTPTSFSKIAPDSADVMGSSAFKMNASNAAGTAAESDSGEACIVRAPAKESVVSAVGSLRGGGSGGSSSGGSSSTAGVRLRRKLKVLAEEFLSYSIQQSSAAGEEAKGTVSLSERASKRLKSSIEVHDARAAKSIAAGVEAGVEIVEAAGKESDEGDGTRQGARQDRLAGHDSVEDARAALMLALLKAEKGPDFGLPGTAGYSGNGLADGDSRSKDTSCRKGDDGKEINGRLRKRSSAGDSSIEQRVPVLAQTHFVKSMTSFLCWGASLPVEGEAEATVLQTNSERCHSEESARTVTRIGTMTGSASGSVGVRTRERAEMTAEEDFLMEGCIGGSAIVKTVSTVSDAFAEAKIFIHKCISSCGPPSAVPFPSALPLSLPLPLSVPGRRSLADSDGAADAVTSTERLSASEALQESSPDLPPNSHPHSLSDAEGRKPPRQEEVQPWMCFLGLRCALSSPSSSSRATHASSTTRTDSTTTTATATATASATATATATAAAATTANAISALHKSEPSSAQDGTIQGSSGTSRTSSTAVGVGILQEELLSLQAALTERRKTRQPLDTVTTTMTTAAITAPTAVSGSASNSTPSEVIVSGIRHTILDANTTGAAPPRADTATAIAPVSPVTPAPAPVPASAVNDPPTDASHTLLVVTGQPSLEAVHKLLRRRRSCLRNPLSSVVWDADLEDALLQERASVCFGSAFFKVL